MPYRIKQDLEVSGTGTFTGNVSVPTGTTNSHAINKLQFDTAINDIRNRDDSKPSVRATIDLAAPEPLSGTYTTATGVLLVVGNRVLVIDTEEGENVLNGPYIVTAGAWTRADDGNISSQSNWRVEAGSDSGFAYVVTNPGTITVGVTSISIVKIAAAASLTGSPSIEIVGSEIRVKTAAAFVDYIPFRIDVSSGVTVNKNSFDSYLFTQSNLNSISDLYTLSYTNISSVLTEFPFAAIGNFSTTENQVTRMGSLFGLNGQTNPNDNGLFILCLVDEVPGTAALKLLFGVVGNLTVKFFDQAKEEWRISGTGLGCWRRISAPTYFQTLSSGAATTHTITHNKRTTRPQVKLFDTVTNEELFAQPSNISLNSFDLVLSDLTNAVQVVVNITPDA